MKSAVCVLIPMGNNPMTATFLSVSRRNDDTLWGLPGGKVDPGETNLEAIVREVREEVGLQLPPEELEPLFSDVCYGKSLDDTFWVTTYLWTRKPEPLTSGVAPEEGLSVSWKNDIVLVDPFKSPFAQYNHGVFRAYQKFMKRIA